MLQAVIFDFDGVITDSEILHFRAFNEVLKQYGADNRGSARFPADTQE
jgi:beta-phosphoglucomutase-like phosphatase (HAD superfamily)